jgi:hypothetical protein
MPKGGEANAGIQPSPLFNIIYIMRIFRRLKSFCDLRSSVFLFILIIARYTEEKNNNVYLCHS